MPYIMAVNELSCMSRNLISLALVLTLLRILQVELNKVEGGHCKEEMILTENTAYDTSQKHVSTFHPLPQDNPAHMYDTVPARQETIYEHIK